MPAVRSPKNVRYLAAFLDTTDQMSGPHQRWVSKDGQTDSITVDKNRQDAEIQLRQELAALALVQARDPVSWTSIDGCPAHHFVAPGQGSSSTIPLLQSPPHSRL